MGSMFFNKYELKLLNISNFDTSKVTHMEHMFENHYALTSLNLSSFNTKKVHHISKMFKVCI